MIHNVGYEGDEHLYKDYPKEALLFKSMITRCYSKVAQARPRNKHYIGCSVDEPWHNFSTFCKDIEFLPRFYDWHSWVYLKEGEEMQLDKDIMFPGNKVYSFNTCSFVTRRENTMEMNNRVFVKGLYEACSPEGDIITFSNKKLFCRDYNLDPATVRKCIKGTRKSTGGYTFKTLEK